MTPLQRAAVCGNFDRFARDTRQLGLSDQEVAEFMVQVGSRWLRAHGVSAANIHTWIDGALGASAPVPLTAAARAVNDIGGRR